MQLSFPVAHRFAALSSLVLVSVLSCSGCTTKDEKVAKTPESATELFALIPDAAPVLVDIDVKRLRSSEFRGIVESLIRRFEGLSGKERTEAAIKNLDGWFGEDLAWIGDRMALAVESLEGPGQSPVIVAAMRMKDEEKGRAFFADKLDADISALETAEYEGISYKFKAEGDGFFGTATIDGITLVASSKRSLERAIVASKKGPSMGTNALAKEAFSTISAGLPIRGVMDMQAYFKLITGVAATQGPSGAAVGQLLGAAGPQAQEKMEMVKSMAFGMDLTKDALELASVGIYDPEKFDEESRDYAKRTFGEPLEVHAKLPLATFAYFHTGIGLNDILAQMGSMVAVPPQMTQFTDQLASGMMVALMENEGDPVGKNMRADAGIVIAHKVKDKGVGLLALLDAGVAGLGAEVEKNKAGLRKLSRAGAPVGAYQVQGDTILLATDAKLIKNLGKGEGLQASAKLKRARGGMSKEDQMMFYLDVPGVAKAAKGMIKDPKAKQAFDSFDALVAGGRMKGDRVYQNMRLSFADDK